MSWTEELNSSESYLMLHSVILGNKGFFEELAVATIG